MAMVILMMSRYNDKRTPSWTDRILWRGFEDDRRFCSRQGQEQSDTAVPADQPQDTNGTFAAVQEVISSDHEPVYCLLDLPHHVRSPYVCAVHVHVHLHLGGGMQPS